jgi:hypothetical protein
MPGHLKEELGLGSMAAGVVYRETQTIRMSSRSDR